jgi:hypothetical protein
MAAVVAETSQYTMTPRTRTPRKMARAENSDTSEFEASDVNLAPRVSSTRSSPSYGNVYPRVFCINSFSSYRTYRSATCNQSNWHLACRRSTKRRKRCTSFEAPPRTCDGPSTPCVDWCKTYMLPPFKRKKLSSANFCSRFCLRFRVRMSCSLRSPPWQKTAAESLAKL